MYGNDALANNKEYQQVQYFVKNPAEIPSRAKWFANNQAIKGLVLQELLKLPDKELEPIAKLIREVQEKMEPLESDHELIKQEMRRNFGSEAMAQFEEDEIPRYKAFINFYRANTNITNVPILQNRIKAFEETKKSANYKTQKYQVSDTVTNYFDNPAEIKPYQTFYGAPLQQQVNQECIDQFGKWINLSHDSPLYGFKDQLIQLVKVAGEYNRQGLTHKATIILDFCLAMEAYSWVHSTLNGIAYVITDLIRYPEAYGQKVLEGSIEGLLQAALFLKDHPLETVLLLKIPKVLLAYHFSRVIYELGGIGYTAWHDKELAAQKWHKCIAPIYDFIDAIKNKKIGPRDFVKGATKLVTEWVAFEGLMNGLQRIANTSVSNVPKSPHPISQPVVQTAEGISIKLAPQEEILISKMAIEEGTLKKVVSSYTPIRDVAKGLHKSLDKEMNALEQLHKKIAQISGNVSKERVGDLLEGMAGPTRERLVKNAESFYEKIRSSATDVAAITKNTGIAEKAIAQIKNHIFIEEHLLTNGQVGRFFADPNIAAAWERLIKNKFVQSDLLLLQHEYTESVIMNGKAVKWHEAHGVVNKLYDWEGALEKIPGLKRVQNDITVFQSLESLENDVTHLSQLFDSKVKMGFGEYAEKNLKIAYEHILKPDITLFKDGNTKFKGYHHDPKNAIEKSGLIKFTDKVMYKNGFYKADIGWNGHNKKKTFFPQHWSREKVISKIVEAYNNFLKSGKKPELTRSGKYEIIEKINEGHDILIHMTVKGEITSAYPYFDK